MEKSLHGHAAPPVGTVEIKLKRNFSNMGQYNRIIYTAEGDGTVLGVITFEMVDQQLLVPMLQDCAAFARESFGVPAIPAAALAMLEAARRARGLKT